ncbi:MAG TPA: hypothetical protein VLT61_09205 [Anaeromyxobacteraceae bacterium]|nr:hypothetical protein [Anaeromyxobacteraceae bacterium]
METTNRRRRAALVALAVSLVTAPIAPLAWSDATHVYMAKHTDKAAGQVTPEELCNRLYGAVAVDMFAYRFTAIGQTFHAVLHDRSIVLPEVPWYYARTDTERAFAYGLASHNNVWGTDATAHFDGITAGNRDGYVIAKAKLLASFPAFRGAVLPLVGNDEGTLLLVSHILVEYAMDLVVARIDPGVGADLMGAGFGCPSQANTELLVATWGPIFPGGFSPEDVAAEIREADEEYHQWVGGYGWALQQPNAQRLVAGAVAKVAAVFLGQPPEAVPYLTELIDGALGVGQYLVAGDLQAELDATIGRVNAELSTRKITP